MRRAFSFLVLFMLPIFAAAQEQGTPQGAPQPTAKRRLKIGVALEGGGALGLAHIGVLQWFEEQHVPVDYIAGTSMGGLVGGFYATGVSPEEMKNLIIRLDWDKILRDHTPYEDLSFLRKQDQRAYPNSLVLGLRKGLYLPGGLSAGHQIGLLIDRETLPYFGLPSFDALPVPFRCVATDLVSGKQFVFKDGPLAEALRATMSIPGAFTPVHDGQHVYVDGGLVNNLPTDVVRQMGADIVIAVHLERQPADAVGSVPLGLLLMRDFTKNVPIMEAGYEAAKGKSKLLAGFALDDAAWNEYVHERDSRKQATRPMPQFSEVQGTSAQAQEDIRRYLKKFIGKPLNADQLDPALTQLTGGGRYNTLNYRIVERNGTQGLLIVVKEKDFAPPTLQPAFEVDGSEAGDTAFQIYAKNDPLADYRIYRMNIGADLGHGFSRFSEVRVGYEVGEVSTKLRLGTPEIPAVSGRVGAAQMRYLMDHTDDPVIPRRGFRVESNFHWFDTSPGTTSAFPVLDARLEFFQPVSQGASFFLSSEGGSTLGSRNTGVPQFFLGGAARLSAYGVNELFGNQYYLFRGGYLHEIASLPQFVGKKVYAIGSYEAGKMYGAANESKFPNDFAAGVLAETALGPFFVGGSVGDSSHHKWFFQLGHVF